MTENSVNEVNNNHRKRRIALAVVGLVLLAGLVAGFLLIQYRKTHITTDDAFVRGSIYQISPRVSWTVLKIYVRDNQGVKSGDLLLELEPDIFKEKVREAAAALQAEKLKLLELQSTVQARKKKISAARAHLNRVLAARGELKAALKAREAEIGAKSALLKKAGIDLKRAERLINKGVIPRDRYETAETVYETALAALKVSKALVRQAGIALQAHASVISQADAALKAEEALLNRLKAAVKTQKKVIERRRAKLEVARLSLSYSRVYAPVSGYITMKSVERGNTVRSGQPLMAVVPLDGLYVVANYKETQIERIRPGQVVRIKIDSYPGKNLSGKVDSIMAGTGSSFSLFPPENATGNYVKVVQRIPIKILLTKGSDRENILRVGMSVVPTVVVQ